MNTHCEICGSDLYNRDMYICDKCARKHCGYCNEIGIQLETVLCKECAHENRDRLITLGVAFGIIATPLAAIFGGYYLLEWLRALEMPVGFSLSGALFGFIVVIFALGLGGGRNGSQ